MQDISVGFLNYIYLTNDKQYLILGYNTDNENDIGYIYAFDDEKGEFRDVYIGYVSEESQNYGLITNKLQVIYDSIFNRIITNELQVFANATIQMAIIHIAASGTLLCDRFQVDNLEIDNNFITHPSLDIILRPQNYIAINSYNSGKVIFM